MSTDTGLGTGRFLTAQEGPSGVTTTLHELTTADGATVAGVLRLPPAARTVVTLMHPRRDVTHHAIVPHLLQAGLAVWTQHPRSVNDDTDLLHEQALLDVAAGMVRLREAGFDHVVTFGHSGGGPLYAFYVEQAALPPGARLTDTPGGRPVPLAKADMPVPDAAVFLAPHPGQGELLLGCIDPSVADESDPLSVRPDLDPFDPANGFRPAPEPSRYDAEFLQAYRAAQRDRVARIDAVARDHLARTGAARVRHREGGAVQDRRMVIAPRVIEVFRTDADPRCVDLSIDPSDRPYGSVFGRRPDLTNYGRVGFGRRTTPEAWLSTWSGLSSRAGFARAAGGVHVPTLLLELTGDQACFPSQTAAMFAALAAEDRTLVRIPGTHFGGPLHDGDRPGIELAAEALLPWLEARTLA